MTSIRLKHQIVESQKTNDFSQMVSEKWLHFQILILYTVQFAFLRFKAKI